MSAAIILVAIAYLNGKVMQTEIGDVYTTESECVTSAKASAEHVRQVAPKDVQIVYKCVDISQVPNAVSVFGAAQTL